MINLYNQNETNFNNNGIATLNPLSATFSASINGAWSLVLVVPYDQIGKYKLIEKNCFIKADVGGIREQTGRQLFRIYGIKKNLQSLTVTAYPVGMEANFDAPVEELTINQCTGVEAAAELQAFTQKYTITSDVTRSARSQYENTNLIAAISGSDDNAFIKKWGGEVIYNNYEISILDTIGSQSDPVVVSYGRNLTGLEYDVDVSQVVTRVYPVAKDGLRYNKYTDTDHADGLSYIDSNTSGMPYTRSAFVTTDYSLIDTNTNSNTRTATATRTWQSQLYATFYNKALELWTAALDDLTNYQCPEYLKSLTNEIINYLQGRYTFNHKGWQSFIKGIVKQSIDWMAKAAIPERGWIERNGWYYGTFNTDGSAKTFPRSQYIYSYEYSSWYYFGADGLKSDETIPQETIDLLNSYTWHTDSGGRYYGDGNGNYMRNAWVEDAADSHTWVGDDGYATTTDSEAWAWVELDGYMYGESIDRYAKSEYVEVNKKLEYFGADGYWNDWKAVDIEGMGWYQEATGTNAGRWWYGSTNRNYAHDEYIYMTVEGVMKEWWYDQEGWYDEGSSGDSDFAWHGDAQSGMWFGEEDAGTTDKSKYIHDKWAFIDGTYYWFNSEGYISADATLAIPDYPWGVQYSEVNGKQWFGNPDKSFNRVWIASQWLKIDNEWYYFDADGYTVDMESTVRNNFADVIYTSVSSAINTALIEAYTLLYTLEAAWVQDQFTAGLDKPAVTISANLIDLSKTVEYEEFTELEKIYLGDAITIRDTLHEITVPGERVVGITYDLLRGYNTAVEIGKTSKGLSQILKVETAGGSAQLIAGDNITINGNVISTNDTAGAVIGIQDVTLYGVSLVRGNIAVLDNVFKSGLRISQYETSNITTMTATTEAEGTT